MDRTLALDYVLDARFLLRSQNSDKSRWKFVPNQGLICG